MLGFEADTEVRIAHGARIDVIWSFRINKPWNHKIRLRSPQKRIHRQPTNEPTKSKKQPNSTESRRNI